MKLYDGEQEITKIMLGRPVKHDNTSIDPSSEECWELRDENGTIIYKKHKTVENCWIVHGLAHYGPHFEDVENGITSTRRQLYVDGASAKKYGKHISMPLVIDWADRVSNASEEETISFNVMDKGGRLWPKIKQWCASNNVPYPSGLFMGSNIDGELTIRTNATRISDCINNTSINRLILFAPNIISLRNAFRGANFLTEIICDSTFPSSDMFGAFEDCCSLKTFPSSIINWTDNTHDISRMCSGCTDLLEIPSVAGGSLKNTAIISYAKEAFNGCGNLTRIGLILNMSNVMPYNSNGINDAYKMFSGCKSLTSVTIRLLGNGNWHFDNDDIHGDLSNLDEQSVKRLINSVNHNTAPEGMEQPEPWQLWCPESWRSYITTPMVQALISNGWELYVGGNKWENYI